jgi:CubicO group peptidase (beta-lactamase class C family)
MADLQAGSARRDDAVIAGLRLDRVGGFRDQQRMREHGMTYRFGITAVAVAALLAGAVQPGVVQAHAVQPQAVQSGAVQPGAAEIDAVFARWTAPGSPGCTVAVEKDGRPVIARAYGLAELEHAVPAATDTVYEAGSVSKQFVASAIILLSLDGKLSLDDDVRRFIPELPDYGAPITLRMMITHTSGLRDWGAIAALEGWPRGRRAMDNQDVLAVVARQTALNHAPGGGIIYSNSNYNLMAVVIERVSGQTLQAFTHDRIFSPLGMTHSRWRDDFTAVVPGRAVAYGRDGDRWRQEMPFENAHGNGGLLTTVGDLMLWSRALDDGRFGADFMRELERPGVLNDGHAVGYASGLFVYGGAGSRARRELSHSGSTGGYRAWLGRYPDDRLTVALLCNAANAPPTDLARQVAALFLPKDAELAATVEPAVAPLTAGLFASDLWSEPLAMAVTDAGPRIERIGALSAVGPNLWRAGGDELAFDGPDRFERRTSLGDRIAYHRVEAATMTPEVRAELVGRWWSDEAQAGIEIRPAANDGLELRILHQPPMAMQPAQKDVFVFGLGYVAFDRDAAGRPTTMRVSIERARNVAFRRLD